MASYGLRVVTPATELPVPVDGPGGFKQYSRMIGRDHENDDIADILRSAHDWFEEATYRTLLTTTYELTIDRLPTLLNAGYTPAGLFVPAIKLPRFPVQSVVHVKYYDTNGVQQTLPGTEWMLANKIPPACVYPPRGKFWPICELFRAESAEIQFVAGYATKAEIPGRCIQAVKYLARHLYENRDFLTDGDVKEVPQSLTNFLGKCQVMGFVK
jgi:uncharacterized phiE125 gp8 family phage protein